jgi:hypothetical protein
MKGWHGVLVVLITVLTNGGCGEPPASQRRKEAATLTASVERFRPQYVPAVDAENLLRAQTLEWLNGPAVSAPRSQAVADARNLTEQWSRVYFVPRHMHEQLRFDTYQSKTVCDVQRRLLAHLKRRYFELHDYQRYVKYAAESEMHHTPPGRLPRQLKKFRARLEARRPAEDEITAILESLAK